MSRLLLRYALLLCAAGATTLSTAPLQAQSSQTKAETLPREGARPRICLVLSGGGARGDDYVGVLKVLE